MSGMVTIEKTVIESANEKVIQNSKAGTPLPCREKSEQEIREAFYRASIKVSGLYERG
jgi:hypothetical protein